MSLVLRPAAVAALLTAAIAASPAFPCTTFQARGADGHAVYGRTLDFPSGVGFLSINPRGLRKRAFLGPSAPWRAAEWTSRFGSVSFSQFGRELPYGGMNEAGLVVDVMVLMASEHPDPGTETPTVSEAGLVQLLLDTQDTVAGAIEAARSVAVQPLMIPLHYLVCERGGGCATLEYLEGRLVTHTGDEMPVTGLTNDPYGESLTALTQYRGFGGEREIPTDASSEARFVRMARDTRAFGRRGDSSIAEAFQLLAGIANPSMPWLTQWRVVYDQSAGAVHFQTAALAARTTVRLASLDFSCNGSPRSLDLDGAVATPARRFFDETASMRRALAHRTLAEIGNDLPEELVEAGVVFPDSLVCER